MFRRQRISDGADPHLTFLSVEEAARLRGLVLDAFAEHGVTVVLRDDYADDCAGRCFGLWNLATRCHHDTAGNAAWPRLVREHVGAILASFDNPDPFATVTAAEAAARAYVHLYEPCAPEDIDTYPHAVQLAPGLIELLALDCLDTVNTFPSESVVRRLGGYWKLYAAGWENLRRVPVGEFERRTASDGAQYHVLTGESVYTASKALLVPELARDLLGVPELPYGVLVGVPNRHELCMHVIRDASVAPSLPQMLNYIVEAYDDAASLSPHLYWWRDGGWQQLTYRMDTAIGLAHAPEFADVLDRLPYA